MAAITSAERTQELRVNLELIAAEDPCEQDVRELDDLLVRLSRLPHTAHRASLANDILDLRAIIVGSGA